MFITKSLRVSLLIALIILNAAALNVENAHAQEEQVAVAPFTQNDVVLATNKARATKGLPALTINAELTKAAELKAADMVANGYFAHFSPTGVTPWHWFDLAGYNYLNAGENLASGFNTTSSLMKGWMNSPTHKANIMGAQYTEIGVAFVQTERNGKTVWYVVQDFGSK